MAAGNVSSNIGVGGKGVPKIKKWENRPSSPSQGDVLKYGTLYCVYNGNYWVASGPEGAHTIEDYSSGDLRNWSTYVPSGSNAPVTDTVDSNGWYVEYSSDAANTDQQKVAMFDDLRIPFGVRVRTDVLVDANTAPSTGRHYLYGQLLREGSSDQGSRYVRLHTYYDDTQYRTFYATKDDNGNQSSFNDIASGYGDPDLHQLFGFSKLHSGIVYFQGAVLDSNLSEYGKNSLGPFSPCTDDLMRISMHPRSNGDTAGRARVRSVEVII